MTKLKERCPFCGGEIFFEVGQELVRCEWCGQTSQTAKFESESMRIHAALEEGEQAKAAVAAAQQEKEKAQERLNKALESLGGIYASQKKADKALEQISREFSSEKEARRNMKELLSAMQGKIGSGENTLTKLLNMVGKRQQDAGEKLEILQTISETVLQNQDNMFAAMAVLPQITAKLDMNAKQQQELAGEFMSWFQGIREEDVKRLKSISAASSALLTGQKVLESKIDSLQEAAHQTQNKIDAFHSEYSRDKLEKLENIFRKAESAMSEKNFDQAADWYQQAEIVGGADADTCWKRLLCHYCVYYQRTEDKKAIPIILNPDLTDPEEMSLRKELKSRMAAAPDVRDYYTRQLSGIDEVLDRYRQVRFDAEYDVFISVKQTDDMGRYTRDSDKASDLYDFLKGLGLKAFNSRRSLPAGELYEPRIISAIMSARVMIVVGSSAENMNADWVKNEWTRFQWLQRREKDSKRKLLCYLTEGMDPYSIPRGLNPDRQAIIDGISAHDALVNAVKDLDKTEEAGNITVIKPSAPSSVESVLNQMTAWLLSEEYEAVLGKYEQVKNSEQFLRQPDLHIKALCAEKKATDLEQLVHIPFVLRNEKLFKIALAMCGSDEERKKLGDLAAQNEKIQEQYAAEAEEWYRKGKEAYQQGNDFLAVSYYQKAAILGHLKAQRALGIHYQFGYGTKEDNSQAEYWLRKAAEKGDAEAQQELACVLDEEDNPEAAKWLTIAAEQGIWIAQTDLAEYYRKGRHVAKDEQLYIYWRERAASYIDYTYEKNQDYSLDYYRYTLAEDYLKGQNVKKDEKRAVEWFRKMAEDPNTENSYRSSAQYELGKCYEKGIGVRKDMEKAIEWYKKAGEGEDCLIEPLTRLGECYETGTGVPKNLKEAIRFYELAISKATDYDRETGNDQKAKERLRILRGEPAQKTVKTEKVLTAEEWYQKHLAEDKAGNQTAAFECCLKAAQMGHQDAQNVVGWRYEVGKGTAKNDAQAFEWYKKAAEAGHRIAQSNLGICYEYGRGVSKDMELAVKWYRKAAENGWPRAQTKLGSCFYSGKGIQKNHTEAVKWFRKAAEAGNTTAQEKLAWCLRYGQGTEKNPEEAVKWYRKAAEAGNVFAQTFLGSCLYSGEGTQKNHTEAVKWFRKAAEAGNATAQDKLAWCLQYGQGTEKNLEEAAKWYRKAAAQNYKGAKERAEALERIK